MTRAASPLLLYRDDDVLVIDKPVGVAARPAGDEFPYLLDIIPDPVDWPKSVVCGVDPLATGVGVFFRDPQHRAGLLDQFVRGAAHREQLALVSGYVHEGGVIQAPLRFDGRRQHVRRARGQTARTEFSIQQRLAGNTLLSVFAVEELWDQARAHLAHIGHPLTVDPRYGGGSEVLLSQYKSSYRPSERRPERPLLARVSVHALRVRFAHPASGATIAAQSEIPKDFRATITQLARLL